MADLINLSVCVDGATVASVPLTLSKAAEASADFRHRAIELTRALSVRCSLRAGEECVCDTGDIDLRGLDAEGGDDDDWVELSSSSIRRVAMRAVECNGWTLVLDVVQLFHTPVVLLKAVRVHKSALAPATSATPAPATGRIERARTFDTRSRARPCDGVLTWSALPAAVSVALARDALVLARRAAGGSSWWIGIDETPRCALEAYAQRVLSWHAREGLALALSCGAQARARCGSQFWVQVRPAAGADPPAASQIAFHFDRDEQLYLNTHNVFEPPFLSTVTYLSNVGAPTLVLPLVHPSCAPLPSAAAAGADEPLRGAVVCSYPVVGKHLLFDGRLLHGCPAGYERPARAAAGLGESARPSEAEAGAQRRGGALRISLLVNVWLAHRPLLSEPLPKAWLPELAPAASLDGLPDALGLPDRPAAQMCAPEGASSGVDVRTELADIETEQLALWCGGPARFHAELEAHGARASTIHVHGARCSTTALVL